MDHVPVFYDIKCVNEKVSEDGRVLYTEIVFLREGNLNTVVINGDVPVKDAEVISFYENENTRTVMVSRLKGFVAINDQPCYRITGSIGEVIRHVAIDDKGCLIETNRILVTSYTRSLAYKPGLFIRKLTDATETLLTPAEVATLKLSAIEVSYNSSSYSIQ